MSVDVLQQAGPCRQYYNKPGGVECSGVQCSCGPLTGLEGRAVSKGLEHELHPILVIQKTLHNTPG